MHIQQCSSRISEWLSLEGIYLAVVRAMVLDECPLLNISLVGQAKISLNDADQGREQTQYCTNAVALHDTVCDR